MLYDMIYDIKIIVIVIAEAHMFWWHYKSPYRVEDSSKPWPIILWLQGGPVSTL
jgi:carboxypeptidase C (cathepsin A)